MSIVRELVIQHLRRERMDIRQLLAAAYYRLHQKAIPQGALDEDARKWEAGQNDIAYLDDLILKPGRR